MATSSNSEVEPILGIQFSIFSPDEIERRSVVEITSNATYEGNEPKIGGLFDPRMGVLENGKQCRSCGQSNNNCPGHFGHYRLARPVYYIQFLPMILNVLSCVCINCSRLRVDKELRSGIKAKSGEGRWKELLEVSSNISRCGQETEDGCGTRQPNRYKREGIARIVAEWDTIETKTVKADSMRQPLEVEYVQRLFRRITDEDVAFMGFNPRWCRPDWMVCSFLAIPPPHVRPSVVQENNQRSEDDLTHKLFEIIKTNNMLQTRIDADANKTNKTYVDELTNVLQYHIATLIDNHIPGVAPSAQRGGRPLKSIQQRLGSKEGRIRYNLQGKRVEMSARSVITPDPNISVAELGVPTRIAMNLTQPERVTEYNIDKLYKLVQNGSAVYPGAKTLVRKDGRMISLAHVNTKEIVLYHGDTVNRHLLDGDMVLFNRQPTLHRMSMMGHRVRVLPYNTFRLNVSVTSPYNADFDGDEMNAHIPQSSEAIQELQDIAAVPYQMISPRHQKPVIKVVQDSLLGTYRITKQGDTFTKREYMNLMMWNKRFDGTLPDSEIISGAPRWSGQKVVSSLFQSMNMDLKNKFYDDDSSENNMVKIREGAIQASGIVDDDVLNKTGVGVVHTTFNDFGPHAAVELIDSLQSTIEAYLVMSGFSVGLSDLVADEATLTTMNEIVQKRKKEIDEIVLQVHMDLFDNSTGKTNQDEFESQVFGKLNKAIEELGKLGQQALAPQNRMISMLKAGSKGSTINVSQMVACVGQQNIEGRRIPYGFTDRTLPHYKKYDDGAEARGFVENSFVKGLTPQEFFFHAMSGREGLIDTAVKSVTGDTPIIVIEQGVPKYLRIGDWIDAHLDSMPDQVEHHVERELELLHLKDTTYIPTADLDGNVTWGQITAVTRHNPGDQLYEILTSAGKRVIVTESKALIIWNPKLNAFERMATPDVKPGHCVPVTATLSTPPVMIDSINIRKYLPPSEYIYGTDFTIAIAQLLVAMENTSKIPSGWWETNNGTTFTLPYPSKARLQQTLVRSNIDEIREGYVYPYSGKRIDTRIPDTFVLSEPNGIFLGLFLAEGNADISSGYVQITNNDSAIRSFAINWFTQHHIQYTEEIKTNAAGGTSSCVRGYSCILAKLLTALVGHGAENKHIPDEAYIAPEAFVKGLLNGYFSGDGTVSKNSVEAGSASSRLIDGISMLCTRLGIFGKIFLTQSKSNNFGTPTILSSHRIAIRAQFATRFSEKITLLDASKQEKLRLMNASLEHRNYPKHNDVVLDKIIKINLIDVKKYPKVYDLTVPSTLNFGLANGLHVVDTAETGYIQRQMVKAMEDLVTQHDGTVRDARMNICQFKYGEDGLSSTKVETQGLPLHTMKEEDLRALITMNGITWADVLTVPRVENAEMVNAFLEQILEDRAMLVNGVFRNGRAKGLMGPMNLDRMIVSLKVKFNLSANAKTDLTPEYVYERLADLQKRTQPYHRMWAAMLRFHLGPHNTVLKHRMTQIAFNALIEQILVKNWAAWAQPGEQVGIIAAQSIGEPATQMSAIASSFVIIEKNGSVYSGPIGAFIDGLLKNSKVKTLGPDSVVLDLEEPMKIIGVSNNEKTSWREISQISRHPANGGLVEVHTRSGRKTTATLTHSFLKRSKEGIVPVLGSDLTVGMRIPVARYIPTIEKPLTIAKQGSTVFTLNKEFGWVCGIYLADGSCNGNTVSICKIAPIVESRLSAFAKEHNMQFSTFLYMGQYGPGKNNVLKSKDLKDFLKATFGEGSFTKGVGSLAYAAPLTFIQGLIGGFFDGDGNISVSKQLIRASSRSKTLLEGINRLLGYCSMFGVLGEETSVRIPDAVQYTLTIPRKFARLYQDTIGFELPQKAKSLINLVQYTEREDAHNTQEMIDKIPEVGTAIATVGRLLGLPGQSRTYGRWAKKESIGRRTLEAYMNTFRTAVQGLSTVSSELASCMAALESALDADVLWDEIVNLVYLDDPKTFVYDFTVPGNDSFMVDDNILVHNTLNTFHLAGVAAKSGMTRGVPRLKELFKVTKSPKATSLSIFLKPEFRENKEKAREVAQDLELTMLRDIVTSLALYYDPSDDTTVIEEDKDLLKFYKFFETRNKGEEPAFSRWMLRMEFNRDIMFNRNITMDDVAYVLNDKFNDSINMVYTDFNTEKLIMRIRISPDLDKTLDSKDDYINFKKFQSRLLTTVAVRGVIGIKATSFSKYENRVELVDGNPTKITEYTIDTDGSNFIEVMNHPAVDPTRLYTTHVHDILDIFGIEASRAILFSEIDSLFTDAGVNYRHLGLLVDTMTRNGRLMSVDRYGINKNAIGPLAKASFEETEKILLRAALFGEMDPVTGVSSKIMTGQPIRGGTTFTHLLLDEAALLRLQKGLPSKKEAEEEDVDDLDEEDIARELAGAADDKCNVVRLRMNTILPESDMTLEEPDVELNIMDG